MLTRCPYTAEQIKYLDSFPAGQAHLAEYGRLAQQPAFQFQPRPDVPAEFDEQTAFLNSTDHFAICCGGTGSGKTITAATKTVQRILYEAPPRDDCPFWVVGESYDLVGSVCWKEKLRHLIPRERIAFESWINARRQWPAAVGITHPDDQKRTGWVLEFKSYSQGIDKFTSASIGGYWCNEEVTLDIVEEIQGRCREYNSPGWADFTPLKVASPEWPRIYDACRNKDRSSEWYREGWQFYHLNTLKNTALAEGWAPRFLAGVEEEMRATRQYGFFASFRGKVFKAWNYRINVIEEAVKRRILQDPVPHPHWRVIRGVDFGWVNPFACVWIACDRDGRYYVFDEHYASQLSMPEHAAAINKREWNASKFGHTYCDHEPQEIANLKAAKCKGFYEPQAKVRLAMKDNPGAAARQLNELMRPDARGKPRFFVSAKCMNLIREIDGYRYGEGTAAHAPMEDPVDKDNHAIAAVLYAVLSDLHSPKAPSAHRREWEPRKGTTYGVPDTAGAKTR